MTIDEAARLIREAVEAGLRDAADMVMRESDKIVPTEAGDLDKSSKVTSDGLRAAVAYDVPHAVIQHENMRLRHDPGKSAKFLEKAGNANRAAIADLVADKIRRAIR